MAINLYQRFQFERAVQQQRQRTKSRWNHLEILERLLLFINEICNANQASVIQGRTLQQRGKESKSAGSIPRDNVVLDGFTSSFL